MSAAPPPVPASRANLGDRIRAEIEREIAAGQWPVGSRIEEQMLMTRFEVSRTPAREAMLQLMSAGLLTSVPRQGAVVAGVSLAEYVAMLEILVELEGLAARLCARRMSSGQRRALGAAAADCVHAAGRDDAAGYVEANRRFHETIYDGSCNAVLASQLRTMRTRMGRPRHSLFDRPGRMRHSLGEHDAVLNAILDGDEDGACAAMTGHISSGGNVYADSIATMTQRAPDEPADPPKRPVSREW